MALEDLNDLFGAVDGFADDFMEYGALGATVVATGVAYTWGTNTALNMLWPTAPAWVKQWGVPLAGVVLGAMAPTGLRAMGVNNRTVLSGVSAGLIGAGVTMALRTNFPNVPLAGLGAPEDEMLLGLGEDLYQRYLGETTVEEESVNGLGAATFSIEEPTTGLSNWTVENMNGVASAFA